jgi:hypothetical protein
VKKLHNPFLIIRKSYVAVECFCFLGSDSARRQTILSDAVPQIGHYHFLLNTLKFITHSFQTIRCYIVIEKALLNFQIMDQNANDFATVERKGSRSGNSLTFFCQVTCSSWKNSYIRRTWKGHGKLAHLPRFELGASRTIQARYSLSQPARWNYFCIIYHL